MSADRDEILNALSVALVTLEAVADHRDAPEDLRTFAERAIVRLHEVSQRWPGSDILQSIELPEEVTESEWFGKNRGHA